MVSKIRNWKYYLFSPSHRWWQGYFTSYYSSLLCSTEYHMKKRILFFLLQRVVLHCTTWYVSPLRSLSIEASEGASLAQSIKTSKNMNIEISTHNRDDVEFHCDPWKPTGTRNIFSIWFEKTFLACDVSPTEHNRILVRCSSWNRPLSEDKYLALGSCLNRQRPLLQVYCFSIGYNKSEREILVSWWLNKVAQYTLINILVYIQNITV